ncbi:methyltransferase [Leucobacter rhizosphaerae]|uniref:Methyltransferase n=1 Tax=Leucobacter rhizosphaerae TaxID=2932245 RepID=A0ABY4FXW6_9MICO|nr:methyltransferase [Leucobacter rhizosphaerae]UOQ60999.1 methyltransferase [Leucobacter rhizosphaerae]
MDLALITRLRADLNAADYRVGAVAALLGDAADAARQRGVWAPAQRVIAARGPSPLATLVRLWLLGETVAADALDAALPTVTAAGAEALGLVATEAADGADGADGLRAVLSLNPVTIASSAGSTEWWILSDLDDQLRRGPARPDHVMGVGGATRSLIAQAPLGARGAGAARALDLGTGCGIVALQLAHDTDAAIIATDISERALELARANAALNDVSDRIDFRRGSLFDPVPGERFELILSNPPFVITPRGPGGEIYAYRDGGLTGDDLVAGVVAAAPAHLAPGGTMLCLGNWECPWGVDGLDRVRGWIAPSAERTERVAGWVIERDRVDPVQYAETWARDGGSRPGTPEFEERLGHWLDDFDARRIVAVGLGAIRLHRLPDGAPRDVWHAERAGGAMSAGAGDELQAAFLAAVRVDGCTDREMLETHWVLGRGVTEERAHDPGSEAPRALTLVTERGIARRITADPLLAAAVGASDGDLTLGQIADALATILDVDADAAAEALVSGVRELVWLGVLEPA